MHNIKLKLYIYILAFIYSGRIHTLQKCNWICNPKWEGLKHEVFLNDAVLVTETQSRRGYSHHAV